MKTFLEKLDYSFLVESTKIGNATFPYSAALSEANAKIKRMGRTKWAYYKERSLASDYFFLTSKNFA